MFPSTHSSPTIKDDCADWSENSQRQGFCSRSGSRKEIQNLEIPLGTVMQGCWCDDLGRGFGLQPAGMPSGINGRASTRQGMIYISSLTSTSMSRLKLFSNCDCLCSNYWLINLKRKSGEASILNDRLAKFRSESRRENVWETLR